MNSFRDEALAPPYAGENGARSFRSPLRGKIRRWYLTTFRKNYVQHQLTIRQGQCSQCGACCRLVVRCPLLTSSQLCSQYHRGRPANCTCFPIDERDLRDVGGRCGYYFSTRISA